MGPNTLLEQEAAQPRVDQATFDFESGFAELSVGETLALCPTVELVILEYPDRHFCITQ
jgi:hypothetical protein